MTNQIGTIKNLSIARARLVSLALFPVVWLAACHPVGNDSSFTLNGYWYPVEIDGQSTAGSSVRLELKDVDSSLLQVSSYTLSIDCDDWGRSDQKGGVLVSDLRDPYKLAPEDQCEARDAKRLDDLRQMTHEGANIRLDPKTYSATISTPSGRSARFDFSDMTPVD